MTTKLMAGIDLHSNNLFCAIVDMEGKRVFEKKLPFSGRRGSVGRGRRNRFNGFWRCPGLRRRLCVLEVAR